MHVVVARSSHFSALCKAPLQSHTIFIAPFLMLKYLQKYLTNSSIQYIPCSSLLYGSINRLSPYTLSNPLHRPISFFPSINQHTAAVSVNGSYDPSVTQTAVPDRNAFIRCVHCVGVFTCIIIFCTNSVASLNIGCELFVCCGVGVVFSGGGMCAHMRSVLVCSMVVGTMYFGSFVVVGSLSKVWAHLLEVLNGVYFFHVSFTFLYSFDSFVFTKYSKFW